MLEAKDKPGAVAVGTRTMQEGGALGPWSREQVELFCVVSSAPGGSSSFWAFSTLQCACFAHYSASG